MKNYKFPINYTSLDIIKTRNNKIKSVINKNKKLLKEDIKKKFVVIKIKYSNLNFKDFLISKGHVGLVKKFPHTAGIDASGTIFYSNSKKFKINDKVFIIAQPLGVENNGSFSEYITVPEVWVNKLPKYLTLKEVMMIGTSGFTAVKAFNKSLKTILKHKKKPVLVTGALSNVGMVLIFLLKNIGANVEVVSSKNKNNIIFKQLGIKKIYILKNFISTNNFSLLTEKYSVVFDNLGGGSIPICLKYLIKNGILMSIGNILGNMSNINILPLILRQVNILSVNAESTNKNERLKILKYFGSLIIKKKLLSITKTINLKEVSKLMNQKRYKKKNFRYVIKI